MKKFYRSYSDRKIWGVCSGLGRYTNTDPLLWRLGLIFLPFPSLLFYIVLTVCTESVEFSD